MLRFSVTGVILFGSVSAEISLDHAVVFIFGSSHVCGCLPFKVHVEQVTYMFQYCKVPIC